jgi:hypothetical protein
MSGQTTALENLYQEELYQIPSRVLVVLSKNWEDLSTDEIGVLTKILAAVKLRLDAVQIVTRQEFTMGDFSTFAPVKILAFGAPLKPQANLYEAISFGGTALVVADALHVLDDAKKKALWLALRQMFGI